MKRFTISGFLYLLLTAFVMAGVTSCYTTSPSVQKKTVVKKKSHPHGGPPGQTKKSQGHPGKRH